MTEKTRLRKTTLGELGANLPIGVESNGQLLKEIDNRKWRFAEDKKMSKYINDHRGISFGEQIAYMIGLLMTKVGPHYWADEMSAENELERKTSVYMLWQSDVLYMYFYLRRQALGNIVEDAFFECPYCGFKNVRQIDLDDLEVLVLDDPSDLKVEVELRDGLRIFGEERKKVLVSPARWELMLDETIYSQDQASIMAAMLKKCIVGAEGCDKKIVIFDRDLDELSKYDEVKISGAINDSPGPRLNVDIESCLGCKRAFTQSLDFADESFFSISSK